MSKFSFEVAPGIPRRVRVVFFFSRNFSSSATHIVIIFPVCYQHRQPAAVRLTHRNLEVSDFRRILRRKKLSMRERSAERRRVPMLTRNIWTRPRPRQSLRLFYICRYRLLYERKFYAGREWRHCCVKILVCSHPFFLGQAWREDVAERAVVKDEVSLYLYWSLHDSFKGDY